MLVGGVSSLASTAASFNPVLGPRSASGATSNVAALPSLADSATRVTVTGSNASSANTSTQAAAKPNTQAATHATVAPKPAPAPATAPAPAPATTANIVESIVSGYSTTVGGTQYLASLEQSGSEYTASVQDLLGATATDSTEVVAENNLNVRINELV